jgi:hypothetical protein
LPKEKSRPIVGNSPNLVALFLTFSHPFPRRSLQVDADAEKIWRRRIRAEKWIRKFAGEGFAPKNGLKNFPYKDSRQKNGLKNLEEKDSRQKNGLENLPEKD